MSGAFGIDEDAKFRPQLERELGQQPLDSSRQVLDPEEPPDIDGAARETHSSD